MNAKETAEELARLRNLATRLYAENRKLRDMLNAIAEIVLSAWDVNMTYVDPLQGVFIIVDKLSAATENAATWKAETFQNFNRAKDAEAEVALLRARVAELEAAAAWIPVGERLPDEEGYYIVLVSEMGGVRFGDWETRGVFECIFRDGYWFTAKDVIAWRPLPTPPEASE